MAPPSAASATRAKDPPGNSPAADWSHGEAGIDPLDEGPHLLVRRKAEQPRLLEVREPAPHRLVADHALEDTRPSAPRARRQLTAGSSRGDRPTPDRPTGLHLLLPGALGARPHVPMTTVTTRRVGERVGVEDRDGSKQRIRVLVADDEAAVRAFLAGIVGTAEELELVAAAADAAEAVELTGVHRPDVAVIDVNMPGGGSRPGATVLRGGPRRGHRAHRPPRAGGRRGQASGRADREDPGGHGA